MPIECYSPFHLLKGKVDLSEYSGTDVGLVLNNRTWQTEQLLFWPCSAHLARLACTSSFSSIYWGSWQGFMPITTVYWTKRTCTAQTSKMSWTWSEYELFSLPSSVIQDQSDICITIFRLRSTLPSMDNNIQWTFIDLQPRALWVDERGTNSWKQKPMWGHLTYTEMSVCQDSATA